jgi:hypothetical protein
MKSVETLLSSSDQSKSNRGQVPIGTATQVPCSSRKFSVDSFLQYTSSLRARTPKQVKVGDG